MPNSLHESGNGLHAPDIDFLLAPDHCTTLLALVAPPPCLGFNPIGGFRGAVNPRATLRAIPALRAAVVVQKAPQDGRLWYSVAHSRGVDRSVRMEWGHHELQTNRKKKFMLLNSVCVQARDNCIVFSYGVTSHHKVAVIAGCQVNVLMSGKLFVVATPGKPVSKLDHMQAGPFCKYHWVAQVVWDAWPVLVFILCSSFL